MSRPSGRRRSWHTGCEKSRASSRRSGSTPSGPTWAASPGPKSRMIVADSPSASPPWAFQKSPNARLRPLGCVVPHQGRMDGLPRDLVPMPRKNQVLPREDARLHRRPAPGRSKHPRQTDVVRQGPSPVKKPFRMGQFPDPGEILSPQEPGLGDLPVRGPNRICANTRRISYISNLLLDMPSSFTRGTVIHVALRSKSCYRTQGRVTPIRKWPD